LAWLLHLIYMHDVWTNPGSAACTPAKIRCTLAVCSLPSHARFCSRLYNLAESA
jgi:hypothetical protein